MHKSSIFYVIKKALFIALASTLLFSLQPLKSQESPQRVSANTYPNLFPGVGIATIDGSIDPMEWANADFVNFTTVGNAEIAGTFYVMQSDTVLYLGVSLADDELTRENFYGIIGDSIAFDFDDDNSGSLYEIGENQFVSCADTPWYGDRYFYTDDPQGSSYADTDQPGGINNGDGWVTRINDLNVYEVAIPLCSGDVYDFCLYPADIVGLRVKYYDIYRVGDDLLVDVGLFPGQDLNSLVLIHLRGVKNYLPVIMK